MSEIRVFLYSEAPKELQDKYNFGGDEDWLIVIPADIAARFTILFEDKERNSDISTFIQDDGSKIVLIGNA